MRAKLIREIPQREGLPSYFRQYELECVNCGEHYFNGKFDKRTVPYCPTCHRKYEREKQKRYQEQKKQKAINEVLSNIMAEITNIEIHGQVDSHTSFIRTGEQVKDITIGIIDKYKQEG